MAEPHSDIPEDMIGDAVPPTPPMPIIEEIDLSLPWYRPAKQFLRREQWNASIMQLSNRISVPAGEVKTLRCVGLPGEHHLDVLAMGRICPPLNLKLDYLGFRTGGGPNSEHRPLREVTALSNYNFYTTRSVTVADSVVNIAVPQSLAGQRFREYGTYHIVNLDVCGGVLHGDTRPILNAIKHVLDSQTTHPTPWLLFVTTAAIAGEIDEGTLASFLSTISSNCERSAEFQQRLAEASTKLEISVEECLANPATATQHGFLRLFTLAFGKWLLGNLSMNTPRSEVRLQSVYGFRNTSRDDPEMLSLAYLITPVVGGGADPSGLTAPGVQTPQDEYSTAALSLISASLDDLKDLDQIWGLDANKKTKIIAECVDLLTMIGVTEDGIEKWKRDHEIAN